MHILWVLSTNGPTRFGALRRQVEGIFFTGIDGAPPRSGAKGLRLRDYEPTIPLRVTYGITKRMKDIDKVMAT